MHREQCYLVVAAEQETKRSSSEIIRLGETSTRLSCKWGAREGDLVAGVTCGCVDSRGRYRASDDELYERIGLWRYFKYCHEEDRKMAPASVREG